MRTMSHAEYKLNEHVTIIHYVDQKTIIHKFTILEAIKIIVSERKTKQKIYNLKTWLTKNICLNKLSVIFSDYVVSGMTFIVYYLNVWWVEVMRMQHGRKIMVPQILYTKM
jgi:RAB protein geranylgeranyltransferase component A